MGFTRLMLNTAWVPVLSGCMMWGGMGHTSGTDWTGETRYAKNGQPLQRAKASSAGLTIALSFATPSGGAAVPIDAQISEDSVGRELTDADIWLRIETPGGAVNELRMEPVQSSRAGAYEAHYSFPVTGLYLVTAEARTGSGSDERTVSVTARAQIYDHAQGGRHQWLVPGAVLGGLGMVATMALMMQ